MLFPLLLSAGAASAKSPAQTASRDSLFIEAAVDTHNPYVGQEVLLTYTLFFKNIAPRISDTGKAEHPGLWAQEVTPEGYIRSTPVIRNGEEYRKAVIKQFRLVPIQAGTLAIANYQLRCFLPQSGNLTLDNKPETERILVAPRAVIEAKPLPKPAPEGFSGAVGDFTISLATDRYHVHAGEPMTIFVKIGGKGNLKTFPPVVLDVPEGFRQQELAVPTVIQEDADRSEEAVTSKIILTPERMGTFTFNPVKLQAFNPLKKRYETVSSGEITVIVMPAALLPKSAQPDSLPSTTPEATKWIPPVVMISMAGGVAILIFVLYIIGARQKKLEMGKKGAEASESAAPASTAPESAEGLRRRIYEALKTVGIPNPSGLTSLQLKKALNVRNIKPECSEALLELLKKIDRAVFTPGNTSGESLEKLNRSTNEVIEALSKRVSN